MWLHRFLLIAGILCSGRRRSSAEADRRGAGAYTVHFYWEHCTNANGTVKSPSASG